jgi:6-phosphogluconolactonase
MAQARHSPVNRFWRIIKSSLLPAIALWSGCCGAGDVAGVHTGRFLAYIGTYTTKGSKGIYVARFDAATGKISSPDLATQAGNPCFLAVHPDQKHLLAAVDAIEPDGSTNSGMAMFAIDRATGRLSLINTQFCGWRAVCHASLDPSGRCALVASYTDGCLAAAPIATNGSLGELTARICHHGSSVNPARQSGPHAHQAVTDPTDRFVFVCDLGMDKIMSYRLDAAAGSLRPNDPPFTVAAPGSGPRHLTFHPNGHFAYVISELANTVTTFGYDSARGALSQLQIASTLPAGFTNFNTAAEVVVHPSGRFLYASNRGQDSVVLFSIDEATGLLSPVEHQSTRGKMPRFIAIDPTGNYLFVANQESDNVVIFRINPADGRLTLTGQSLKVSVPVCIAFVPME